MTRNLKALGLSLIAALALSATAAAGASAQEFDFTASETPAVVIGEQEGNHVYDTGGGKIECSTAQFESEAVESTSNESVTINPTYEGCELHNNLLGTDTSATVFMNGCQFEFTVTEQTGEHKYKGEVHVKCPGATKHIIIRSYKTANHNEVHCEYTVGEQTVKPVEYEVTTVEGQETYVDVRANEAPTSLKKLKGGFFTCGPENQTAKYSGDTKTETVNPEEHSEMYNGGIEET